MWSPKQTQSRADYLAQPEPDWWKPRLQMPLRVSLAIFGVLATMIVIALLLVIAASLS